MTHPRPAIWMLLLLALVVGLAAAQDLREITFHPRLDED